MAPLNETMQKRLSAIGAKGWDIAERLAKLKANKHFDLSDIDGPNLDLSAPKEERLRAFLDMIERSRTRLLADDGSYGYCLSCTHAFTEIELNEMPWIEYCSKCQD